MRTGDCKFKLEGKRTHPSKAVAKLHAKRHASKFGGARPEVYFCPDCDGWHLGTPGYVASPRPCRVCGQPIIFDYWQGSSVRVPIHAVRRDRHFHKPSRLAAVS